MMNFNAKETKDDIVQWIRDWFDNNGRTCNAIVGISGGKDSTIVTGLLVEALGKDRVKGVLMPNGEQKDISVSMSVVDYFDIEYVMVNIQDSFDSIIDQLECNIETSDQTIFNLPARLRMSTLYAYSQSMNGRVVNTCNLSEDYVGYSTRYGDSVGDFSPFSNLTVSEVKQIGYELGIPSEFIEKTPQDGLCGKSDEDNLGFTYEVLDKYIRTGICDDLDTRLKIDYMNEKNKFKLRLMDCYNPYYLLYHTNQVRGNERRLRK